MGFLKWGPQFELGIPDLDQQHRKWLELLNRFYDGIGSSDLQMQVGRLVDEAINYTQFHFQEEEKFMASIKFPHLEEQKRMHAEITETLQSYRKALLENRFVVSTEITKELKNWFREHILIEDMKYAAYFREAHAAAMPR